MTITMDKRFGMFLPRMTTLKIQHWPESMINTIIMQPKSFVYWPWELLWSLLVIFSIHLWHRSLSLNKRFTTWPGIRNLIIIWWTSMNLYWVIPPFNVEQKHELTTKKHYGILSAYIRRSNRSCEMMGYHHIPPLTKRSQCPLVQWFSIGIFPFYWLVSRCSHSRL